MRNIRHSVMVLVAAAAFGCKIDSLPPRILHDGATEAGRGVGMDGSRSDPRDATAANVGSDTAADAALLLDLAKDTSTADVPIDTAPLIDLALSDMPLSPPKDAISKDSPTSDLATGDAIVSPSLDSTSQEPPGDTHDSIAGADAAANTDALLSDTRDTTGGADTEAGMDTPGFTLSAATAGDGNGKVSSSAGGIDCGVSCSVSLAAGTVVTLAATPNEASTFAGWSGACTGIGTCTLTMDAAKTVVADFGVRQFRLAVSKAGTGNGTVTSSVGGISCGTACSSNIPVGTAVSLTATPDGASTFAGWSGACSGSGGCVVAMNASNDVVATFNAVPFQVSWVAPYSAGVSPDYIRFAAGVAADSLGNAYAAFYKGQVDGYDIVVNKYTCAGSLEWSTVIDAGWSELPTKLAIDKAGNVLVSGFSQNNVTVEDDMVLAKLNPQGVVQWQKRYDGGTIDMVSGGVFDTNGDVLASGVRSTGGPDPDRYIVKYDSNGVFVWSHTDTYSGRDREGGIVIGKDGHLYASGPLDNAFRTTKYDSSGTVIWDQVYDPGVWDYANDVAVDSMGNVFTSGFSCDNVSYSESVVLKYDSSGSLAWFRTYTAGGYADAIRGLAADNSGGVYLVAQSLVEPWRTTAKDVHTLRYDAAGNLVMDLVYDSGGNDGATGLALGPDGSIYVGAYVQNGATYDFRLIKYPASGGSCP